MKTKHISLIAFLVFCLCPFTLFASGTPALERTIRHVAVLHVDTSINPAVFSYLEGAFERAQQRDDTLILITLNTPGGLVSTTKQILTLIGQSRVPVAIWIAPEGASATSAGAIICSAAHYLFMAPGTNIGAATPVEMGSDIKGDMKSKAVNDLVALTQSLAETRGRNGILFADMVAKASSFKSHEALEKKLINGIANSIDDVLNRVHESHIQIMGQTILVRMAPDRQIETVSMDAGQSILNIFANPMTAYVLFLVGAALLYLEFQTAGGFIAGSLGAICLILSAIGFQVLPVNWGAVALIIVSFILFILELYVTTYGILAIAGLISLIFGSSFLYRSAAGSIELPHMVIYSTALAVAIFMAVMGIYLFKNRRKKKTVFFSLIGREGTVVGIPSPGHYQVKIAAEIWNATSLQTLAIGDSIIVTGETISRLELKVQRHP